MDMFDRSQAWFWSPEWQQAEEEATEDIEAGRVLTFATADEAIEALESYEDADK